MIDRITLPSLSSYFPRNTDGIIETTPEILNEYTNDLLFTVINYLEGNNTPYNTPYNTPSNTSLN